MSKIKKLVRSHNLPLEQVAKRLGEKKSRSGHQMSTKAVIVKKSNGAIRKIILNNNCTLGTNLSDSCFSL